MNTYVGFDASFLDTDSVVRPLTRHLEAVKTKDVAMLREAFAPDALFVGTDDTEQWPLDTLAEQMASSETGWEMNPIWRTIRAVAGQADIATFYEVVKHTSLGIMRGSGLLVKQPDGTWKIAQYILSFSVPNDIVDKTNLVLLLASKP